MNTIWWCAHNTTHSILLLWLAWRTFGEYDLNGIYFNFASMLAPEIAPYVGRKIFQWMYNREQSGDRMNLIIMHSAIDDKCVGTYEAHTILGECNFKRCFTIIYLHRLDGRTEKHSNFIFAFIGTHSVQFMFLYASSKKLCSRIHFVVSRNNLYFDSKHFLPSSLPVTGSLSPPTVRFRFRRTVCRNYIYWKI